MLHIAHLTKQFDSAAAPIIDNLEWSLPDGESLSIRGASGSGKSTLLALIAGFEQPDAGTITIGPSQLPFASARQGDAFRRERLGVVFQSYNLLDCLSVWDNIAFTARLKGNADEAFQRDLMQQLGIAQLAKRPAHQLSGGEQQRAAIARALVHRPQLVLADEPTGNLDEQTSEQVTSALYATCQAMGTTLVVVTHSQAVAEQARQQAWLRHGQLHSTPA